MAPWNSRSDASRQRHSLGLSHAARQVEGVRSSAMKTLFLIRHAKSSWADPALPDKDRPLGDRGRRDARKMGKVTTNVHGRGAQEAWCRRSVLVSGAGVVSPIKSPDSLNAYG